MVRIERLGFSVISPGTQNDQESNEGPAVNVVLVHGLRGHPRRSWESSESSRVEETPSSVNSDRRHLREYLRSKLSPSRFSNNRNGNHPMTDDESPQSQSTAERTVFWPKDLLAPSIPNARILVYGYNADVFGGLFQANNKNSLSQHGNDLMVKLGRARPIIFIAHSLGGIVVKDAIWRCKTSLIEKYKDLHRRTDTVIFLGTPHRGTSGASWGEIASRLAAVALQDSNRELVANLAVDSEILDNIHAQFLKMLHTNDFHVHSFQEGRGPTGLNGFSGKLDYPLEVVETIDADHVGMVKFASASSAGYGDLLKALQDYIKDAQTGSVDLLSSFPDAARYLQQLYCVDYEGVFFKVPNPHVGTCSWLTQNFNFVAWKRSEQSTLCWLYGSPGYGKTVLAKSVIQSLAMSSSSGPRSPVVVYFFCLDQDERRKSSIFLLKSILHQILVAEPGLCKVMKLHYARMNWQFLESDYTLWKLLRDISSALLKIRPLYVVLDALDELSSDCRNDFVKNLLDYINHGKIKTAFHQLRIFATSRPESQLQDLFSNQGFSIELDTTRNKQDLMTFVSETVDEFARQNSFPPLLGQKIRTEIVDKAQGMFLWASLAWESFKEGVASWTPAAVERQLKALRGLSPGLHPLYQRLLSQVNPRWVPELERLFIWLVAAVRPLSTAELAVALALQSHHRVVTDLDVAFSIPQFVKRVCPNLVRIDSSGNVSLVHHSFKEFLVQSEKSGLHPTMTLPLFHVDVGAAHVEALACCFNYLSLDDVCALSEGWRPGQGLSKGSKARTKFSFLEYAALEWRLHFRLANASEDVWLSFKRVSRRPACVDLMFDFSIAASSSGEHIWRLNFGLARSPFSVALHVRSKMTIKRLVEEGANINEGSPLFECEGDPEIFEYLLELGADPNDPGGFGCSPLLWAVRQKRLPMMKILLEHPNTNLNMQDKDGRTALHWATRWDWNTVEAVLDELLSDERIDVNIANKSGQTPVAYAAYWGKEIAVKRLLLSPKTSLEKGEMFGESPIVSAAQQCWESIVLGMLGRVLDISQHEDQDHRGIIHWTVINRWDNALRLVIHKPGCKINKIDARGMTALHYAAEEGNYFAARLLLKNSAVADIMDNTGKTPAHVAAQCFSTQILRLILLERSLDVNEQDADGRTILHWLAMVDSTAVIQLLLDQGANLTRKDRDGRTPMHVAAACRCPAGLRLLFDNLEEDFNINSSDSAGNTLLHVAAREGYTTIVSDLIRRGGLLVNKRNSWGETALDCSRGLRGMSEMLMNIGARYASTSNPFGAPFGDENNPTPVHGRPTSPIRPDHPQDAANRYDHFPWRPPLVYLGNQNPLYRDLGPLVIFDFEKGFEDWETWFIRENHITRPMCRGKLLDIYATRIGSARKYADFMVEDMLGDEPTYRCTVCNSDGTMCREGSTALRESYAKMLYDMKYAKTLGENWKRLKDLSG